MRMISCRTPSFKILCHALQISPGRLLQFYLILSQLGLRMVVCSVTIGQTCALVHFADPCSTHRLQSIDPTRPIHMRNVRGVPVPTLFGLGVPHLPLFRTQVKNLLSSEAICGDQITLKPFSAGASPESSCLVLVPKHAKFAGGLQG